MRIAILTQPLHGNYGGILQNYALQEVLKNMRHQPVTIDRHILKQDTIIEMVAKWLLRLVKSEYQEGYLWHTQKTFLMQRQQTFIDKYIEHTKPLYTQQDFDEHVRTNTYDAYIVGSDQCWRPCYAANIYNMYLDFAENIQARKIAYAASFGVDKWEYNPQDTERVKSLAKLFGAISVREYSGINLCKDNLGVTSSWVLDPTMLLGKDGFMQFINIDAKVDPYVLIYFLEDQQDNNEIVEYIGSTLGISSIKHNIDCSPYKRSESLEKRMKISVEEWLNNIYNSSFVVTDSFHGIVFSILFNKPFIAKLNGVRGNTRVLSLLSDVGLTDCIYSPGMKVPNIDWNRVNRHLSERQKDSMEFLRKALD